MHVQRILHDWFHAIARKIKITVRVHRKENRIFSFWIGNDFGVSLGMVF